ncbi:hypothetical protein BD560DRAFT_403883 [Blakeslea trispora]|nr:hypothetical protein BD560DRAFT_403883 [Blakeslea trispora]
MVRQKLHTIENAPINNLLLLYFLLTSSALCIFRLPFLSRVLCCLLTLNSSFFPTIKKRMKASCLLSIFEIEYSKGKISLMMYAVSE